MKKDTFDEISKREEAQQRGREFKRRLSISTYKKNEFAELMGFDNPQNVTHWYKRGVPAKYATKVSALLGCEPEEISDLQPAQPISPSVADEITEREKREIRRMVNDILDAASVNRQAVKILEGQLSAIHRLISE